MAYRLILLSIATSLLMWIACHPDGAEEHEQVQALPTLSNGIIEQSETDEVFLKASIGYRDDECQAGAWICGLNLPYDEHEPRVVDVMAKLVEDQLILAFQEELPNDAQELSRNGELTIIDAEVLQALGHQPPSDGALCNLTSWTTGVYINRKVYHLLAEKFTTSPEVIIAKKAVIASQDDKHGKQTRDLDPSLSSRSFSSSDQS